MARFQISLTDNIDTRPLFVIDTHPSRGNIIEIGCDGDRVYIQLKDSLPLSVGQKIEIKREK